MQNHIAINAAGEILSEEWKLDAFMYVFGQTQNMKDEKWVTGYWIYRKFHVKSLCSAYNFIDRMHSLGMFRFPIEGGGKKVRITDLGKEMYFKLELFLKQR